MRIISLLLLSLSVFCYSGVSSASTLITWVMGSGANYSSAYLACRGTSTAQAQWVVYNNGTTTPHDGVSTPAGCHRKLNSETQFYYIGNVNKGTQNCPFGDNGTACNASCDHPKVMEGGQCVTPTNPCAQNAGVETPIFETFDSYEDYNRNCKVSINGCQVDACADATGAGECFVNGKTGKFECYGNGKFTGENSEGTDDPVASQDPTVTPDPTETDSSTQCTMPAMNGTTVTYTCTKETDSNQFANSNCSVGEVNGVKDIHCTKPDYVPESDKKKVTDNVTETTNPDGSKITVTGTTTERTKCVAGACTTTTTTETTTTTKDPSGNTTGESTQCTGDNCDNPNTPEDESEEEKEEGVEREVAGEDCSANLACAGDAIDCAILRKQKEQNCAMDWNANKSAVLAEAGKSEYELGMDEIDAADLFSGPSAGRWLTPTCPADRVLHLATTGTSITFSWSYVCQYASALGNLVVALASLFFAVYVGRAFGGD